MVMITDRPDMTSAVSVEVKHKIKQTKNKIKNEGMTKTNKGLELLGKGPTRCVAG